MIVHKKKAVTYRNKIFISLHINKENILFLSVFCTNLLSSFSSVTFLSHQTGETLDLEAQAGKKVASLDTG